MTRYEEGEGLRQQSSKGKGEQVKSMASGGSVSHEKKTIPKGKRGKAGNNPKKRSAQGKRRDALTSGTSRVKGQKTE